jgi:hypothetical protein
VTTCITVRAQHELWVVGETSPITPIDPDFGEQKAQSGENAWFRTTPPLFRKLLSMRELFSRRKGETSNDCDYY